MNSSTPTNESFFFRTWARSKKFCTYSAHSGLYVQYGRRKEGKNDWRLCLRSYVRFLRYKIKAPTLINLGVGSVWFVYGPQFDPILQRLQHKTPLVYFFSHFKKTQWETLKIMISLPEMPVLPTCSTWKPVRFALAGKWSSCFCATLCTLICLRVCIHPFSLQLHVHQGTPL